MSKKGSPKPVEPVVNGNTNYESARPPLAPLAALELRNAFNRAVQPQRITAGQRDALWQDVEADIASGFLVLTPVASDELPHKARQLSDRYTPTQGTRSLDLLHVVAALVFWRPKCFSALMLSTHPCPRYKTAMPKLPTLQGVL